MSTIPDFAAEEDGLIELIDKIEASLSQDHAADIAQEFEDLLGEAKIQLSILGEHDLRPWLEAATNFTMNTDFELEGVCRSDRLDPAKLMAVMKKQSTGKKSIQALGDKYILQHLIKEIGVPQMPLIASIRSGFGFPASINKFIDDVDACDADFKIIAKPTHLSSGRGAFIIKGGAGTPTDTPAACDKICTWLVKDAGETESEALRQLKPGYIAQPMYSPCSCFKLPAELRVVTVWGKARIAVWWWGRGENSYMNTWFIQKTPDLWDVLHKNPDVNPAFEAALNLFTVELHHIAPLAESIASAVGAPFLRSDFFVGDPKWGVRLNEVAYGSGIDLISQDARGKLRDDLFVISRLLYSGLSRCRKESPDWFLSKLGLRGASYSELCLASRDN